VVCYTTEGELCSAYVLGAVVAVTWVPDSERGSDCSEFRLVSWRDGNRQTACLRVPVELKEPTAAALDRHEFLDDDLRGLVVHSDHESLAVLL
jgi:hypothetical protein